MYDSVSGNRTDIVYHNVIVLVNNFVFQLSDCQGFQSILGYNFWFFSRLVGRKGPRGPGFKDSSVCFPGI